jgi:hypothetical protein
MRWRVLVLLSALFIGLVVMTVVVHAAADYDHKNLSDQLSAQKITMPTAAAMKGSGVTDPADVAALAPYEGRPMTTGAQAEAFADHYIGVHLRNMGKTYDQASSYARAHPKDTAAAALVQTVFQGTMLRSSLLQAWGWGQVGDYAALGSWVLAVLALVVLLALLFELFVAPRSPKTALP